MVRTKSTPAPAEGHTNGTLTVLT